MKIHKIFLYPIIALLLCNCSNTSEIRPKFIKSQYQARQNSPFSDVTEYDGLLFLTGQIGKNHNNGKLVEGGIQAEAYQALTNLKDVLEANGSDMNHVLKCTVVLSDIDDFAEMNEVYKTFFPKNKPSRTTFGADLVGNAKIEIEVIAVKY
jgi:2-iminobutanoate/2-iminopropanoate deaminase